MVSATCEERCRLIATGRLSIGGRPLRRSVQSATSIAPQGDRISLALRVVEPALSRVRRALAAGRRVIVAVTVRAFDRAGNRSTSGPSAYPLRGSGSAASGS